MKVGGGGGTNIGGMKWQGVHTTVKSIKMWDYDIYYSPNLDVR